LSERGRHGKFEILIPWSQASLNSFICSSIQQVFIGHLLEPHTVLLANSLIEVGNKSFHPTGGQSLKALAKEKVAILEISAE
jgi:hypothetical protein